MNRFVQRQGTFSFFERPEGMSPTLHRLLMARGIDSAEAAEKFLHPRAEDFRDPFELSDMDKAVSEIRAALDNKEPICVYGDYDVDGVSASSILGDYLRSVGGDVRIVIPSRHKEGYGLHHEKIHDIAQLGVKLLVTVDCGVTNVDEIAYAKRLGLRCVVTDHHTPPEVLPDCPVVDPLINGYAYGTLCGGGVAFKVVCALGGLEAGMRYVDIAALATVADIVPLTGENRIIVKLGLERMNCMPRCGIAALKEMAALDADKPITAGHIAFQLAPRINAGGRIGDASRGVALLLAQSREEADPIADALEEENKARKEFEKVILEAAEAQMKTLDLLENRIIILAGEGWNPGVIGLAASRLVEKTHYPVILLSDDGEKLVGSCRSIPGVNMIEALRAHSRFFERFGGHKQAAGLTMPRENLPEFIREMNAYLRENVSPAVYVPLVDYDIEVDLNDIDEAFVEETEALQPCGFGNPSPLLRAKAHICESYVLKNVHLKMILASTPNPVTALWWSMAEKKDYLPKEADFVFTAKLDTFRCVQSVSLEVKSMQSASKLTEIAQKRNDEPILLHEYLTDKIYNKGIDFSENTENIDEDALVRLLTQDPQGTLVLTADLDTAERIYRMAENSALRKEENAPEYVAPDFFCGALPEAPSVYNMIWAYPKGEMPLGFRTVVFAGVPPFETAAQSYVLSGEPSWKGEVPTLMEMRNVIVSVRRNIEGKILNGKALILAKIADDTALTQTKCAIACAVLCRMGLLIEVKNTLDQVISMQSPREKGNPEEDALYRSLNK